MISSCKNSLSSTEHILTMTRKTSGKHLLHQTSISGKLFDPTTRCHFKVVDSSDPFGNKKSPHFQAVAKLLSIFWKAIRLRRLDVKTPNLGVSWWSNLIWRSACFFQMGWFNHQRVFYLKSLALFISRDMFPSSNPSKPQGILSQAARICVFYYHCPKARKISWTQSWWCFEAFCRLIAFNFSVFPDVFYLR